MQKSRIGIRACRGGYLLLAVAMALAACGTRPPVENIEPAPIDVGVVESGVVTAAAPSPSQESAESAESTESAPTLAPAPAPADNGTSDGKYYLDDGPPPREKDRVALLNTPDAVVRWEKIKPAHNRPYTALGNYYEPYRRLTPYHKRGVASWYGKRYHGKKTSSGEPYDMFAMTAAHPVLPIPSYVRVTRVATGEQVVVRVNDRGPFLRDRIIDLSYAAATRLGIVASGTGEVIVESILPDNAAAAAQVDDGAGEGDIKASYFIQVGAFSDKLTAESFQTDLQGILPADYRPRIHVKPASPLWPVQIGPYDDYKAASKIARRLCDDHDICGFIKQK